MKRIRQHLRSVTPGAKKLLRFLSLHREKISPLLILTHDYPDPDTLASSFALAYLAEKRFAIQTRIAYGGIIGRTENRALVNNLKIPAHKITPMTLKKYPNVALIDTQPAFGNNSFPKNRKATLVIDQHPFVKKPLADLAIVDTECGATSVILAQALLHSKMEIPARVATSLAYGILSDTMNLYRVGRPDVIETFMDIVPYCDMRALAQIQNPVRSRRFFKTLGKAIQNATARRGLIVAHLGSVENPDLVSQITDFLLSYKGGKKAICTGRYKGKLHVSLRIDNQNANAGEILRDVFVNRGKAGGHGGVAGGSFEVGKKGEHFAEDHPIWQESEEGVIQRLLKRLRIPSKGDFYYPFR